MKKYLFVVYGDSPETEGGRAAGMAEMAQWYKSLGKALLDPGAPFTGAKTVSQEGVDDGPIGPNASGYNLVQADSLEAAAELARGCPCSSTGSGLLSSKPSVRPSFLRRLYNPACAAVDNCDRARVRGAGAASS
jgi:hypothetical protein